MPTQCEENKATGKGYCQWGETHGKKYPYKVNSKKSKSITITKEIKAIQMRRMHRFYGGSSKDEHFKHKYLKYKQKYLELKNIIIDKYMDKLIEIQNFFTKDECDNIINKYNDIYFGNPKKPRFKTKRDKTSYSKLVEDDEIMNLIKIKLNQFNILNKHNIKDIHNKIRVVHYYPGQNLGIHRDMVFNKNFNQVSHTLFVYLNEEFEGGCTRIYDMKPSEPINIYTKNKPNIDIVPKTGKALLYPIETVHEGREVTDGEKWLIIFKLYS